MDFTKNKFEEEKSIIKYISAKVGSNKSTLNIICAGHFLLMPNEIKNKLIPAIFNNDKTAEEYYGFAKNMIGIFPQYTFDLAATVLNINQLSDSTNLISILINDWQLVPVDTKQDDLSKPNSYRENFYKEFSSLPNVYNEILHKNDLDFNEIIYKSTNNNFYLKEVSLRDRFMRKMKSFFHSQESNTIPVGMCSLGVDECGNIKMINEDNILHNLSVNSKAGCAAGVSQMILDVYEQYCKKYDEINFINFMPSGCTNPVNIASELAINMINELESKSKVNILNFYFDGSGTKKAEDFYNKENNKGVTGYMFNQ